MKAVRLVLGVVVGAYGLYNLSTILIAATFKLGLWRRAEAQLASLMEATAWWQLAAWTVVAGTVLVAAWRLANGRPAFLLALSAFAADSALWWIMHAAPAYQQAFTSTELGTDYLTFVGMLAALLAIWLAERPGRDAAAI